MKAYLVVTLTLFLAMWLSIVAVPQWALWARPEWTLLVLIFWALYAPDRCGVFLAASVGLFQDGLTASVLGKHVLTYSLVIAVTVLTYKRLRMYAAWQQAAFVFLLVGLNQLLGYWIGLAVGQQAVGMWFLYPALMSALLWPGMMILLRNSCMKAGLIRRML